MNRAISNKLLGCITVVVWLGGSACDLDMVHDGEIDFETGPETESAIDEVTIDLQSDAELLPDHLVMEGLGEDELVSGKGHSALAGCGTSSSVTTSSYELVDGKTIKLTINWSDSSNSDHSSYDVKVYFYRREGGSLDGPHYSATFSNIGKYTRALVATIGGIDTFDQLGKMSDGTESLWQVDVRARLTERCSSSNSYRYSSYRPDRILDPAVPRRQSGHPVVALESRPADPRQPRYPAHVRSARRGRRGRLSKRPALDPRHYR